jgi:signal peptidase I
MTSSYIDPRLLPAATSGSSAVPPRRGFWERRTQNALQALWVGVIPALLSGVTLRYLVPPIGPGIEGAFVESARQLWLPFAIGLFFLFSGMARYWRFRMPGGRYASSLPAHIVPDERDAQRLAEWASAASLYEFLLSARMRRRVRRSLDEATAIAIQHQIDELRAGLEAGDYARANAAVRAVEGLAAKVLEARRRAEALGALCAVVFAGAAALGVRAVVEPYRVLSASMLPTLEPNDVVVSSRLAYRSLVGSTASGSRRLPRRGDLVLFHSDAVAMRKTPGAPDLLVKRVIGLPGDQIAMLGDVPAVNGVPVPYCSAGKYMYIASDGETVRGTVRVEFAEDRPYLTLQSLWTPFEGTYTVKPGEVFVLGDSRSNSLDSRAWNDGHGGGVPLDAVVGRVDWSLIERQRGGDIDFGGFLRRLDTLGRRTPIGGPDEQPLKDGIAECVRKRLGAKAPSAPGDSGAARADKNVGAQP